MSSAQFAVPRRGVGVEFDAVDAVMEDGDPGWRPDAERRTCAPTAHQHGGDRQIAELAARIARATLFEAPLRSAVAVVVTLAALHSA